MEIKDEIYIFTFIGDEIGAGKISVRKIGLELFLAIDI